MKTMYRFNKYLYGNKKIIETVSVTKETAHFVTLEGYRSRFSKNGEFFNSFEEAKAFVVDLKKRKLEWARGEVLCLERELASIEALQP